MPPLSEKFPDGLVTWWPQIKSTSWNEQNLQLQTRHPRKENRTPGDAEEREANVLKKDEQILRGTTQSYNDRDQDASVNSEHRSRGG